MSELRGIDNNSLFELVEGGWRDSLCYEAEYFLHDNIKDDKFCLLNDTILMKHIGYAAGVAIREVIAEGGIIKPGTWYQLDDREQKRAVRDVSHCGRNVYLSGLVPLVENRKMREYVGGRSMSGDELLDMAVKAAKRLVDRPKVLLEL